QTPPLSSLTRPSVHRDLHSVPTRRSSDLSKVIVESEIYEEFKEKLVQETKKITVGNGLKDGIWMGPCASESQFNTVRHYINVGKDRKSTRLTPVTFRSRMPSSA